MIRVFCKVVNGVCLTAAQFDDEIPNSLDAMNALCPEWVEDTIALGGVGAGKGWTWDGAAWTRPASETVVETKREVPDHEFTALFTGKELKQIAKIRDSDTPEGDDINKLWMIAEQKGTVDLLSPEVAYALDIFIASATMPQFDAARKAQVIAGEAPA
jgi:hypothetical protein